MKRDLLYLLVALLTMAGLLPGGFPSGSPSSVLAVAPTIWSSDPTINIPIAVTNGDKGQPVIVSDNTGSAIIVWADNRSGNTDIYAQKVNSDGVVQWTVNGLPICTARYIQENPAAISDGSGGAIIVWDDHGSGPWDYGYIYAQRINSSGIVQWAADGIPVCTTGAIVERGTLRVIGDGLGGVIITWRDGRNGNWDIYAQKIDATGNSSWTTNGVAVCTEASNQYFQELTTDGSSGAIVTWQDSRNGPANFDIYAQRIDASGNALWTANGTGICITSSEQIDPELVFDGSGGAIIVWYVPSLTNHRARAQRVNSFGNILWGAGEGVSVFINCSYLNPPKLVSDGSGGAIIVTEDQRNVGGDFDLYVQRINSSGVVQWTEDGIPICTANGWQYSPVMKENGAGGAIIAWEDNRGGNYDIYAQSVNSSGVAQWAINGIRVSIANGNQTSLSMVSDGTNGAIITWQDSRNGTNSDIYVQQVFAAPVVLPGDANGDGLVNAVDITETERIIIGLDVQTPGADANQDGHTNAIDITFVERLIAGLH
jgi:hypothetical protein